MSLLRIAALILAFAMFGLQATAFTVAVVYDDVWHALLFVSGMALFGGFVYFLARGE